MSDSVLIVSQKGDVLEVCDNPHRYSIWFTNGFFILALMVIVASVVSTVAAARGQPSSKALMNMGGVAVVSALGAFRTRRAQQRFSSAFQLTRTELRGSIDRVAREEVASFGLELEEKRPELPFREVVVHANLKDGTRSPVLWFSRELAAMEAVRHISVFWDRRELAEVPALEMDMEALAAPSDEVLRPLPGVYAFKYRFGTQDSGVPLVIAGLGLAAGVYDALLGSFDVRSAMMVSLFPLGLFWFAPRRKTLRVRSDGVGLESKFSRLGIIPWRDVAGFDQTVHPTRPTVYLTKTNGKVLVVSPALLPGDAAWLLKELRLQKRVADATGQLT